jgi:class 3 adenylate cyclase
MLDSATEASQATAARPGDELRPVTALFADIVGSTALGERLTPDEVKVLVGECVTRMSRAVEEFGGTIQAYAGDGICAYFGVPAAHEDDAERAARAGLSILEVIGDYGRDIRAAWGIDEFNVRVGINTGRAGVGTVGAADPQTVALGDATNVAARLESSAAPGTVAVGEVTARLLEARFDLEPLGERSVKGRAQPVSAWRLMGLRDGSAETSRAPLVGRDAEMVRLREELDGLGSGLGRVLLVSGEAGIGKTRLLGELRRMAGERVTWLDARCPSYGGELLARPFVDLFRGWLGLQEGEPEIAVRMRLRARLGALLGADAGEAVASLSRFVSVKVESDDQALVDGLSAEALWERVRSTFRLWIGALAARGPVVVAIDDLHWADRSTSQLAEDLLELTDRDSILVAAAFRPDPDSEAWRFRVRAMSGYPHRLTEIALRPLAPEACRELAIALAPPESIDDVTREGLVLRAEGNPLFLEELLRGVVGQGGASARGGWTMTMSTRQWLPPSLESLFAARIDGLPPGPRRVVQAAAAIGRTFPVRVLERLVGSETFAEDMATLYRADLIRETRRYPEPEGTFKHGLVHEAAMSTLPLATLRELYGRVGAIFEEIYRDSITDYLEILAYYLYRSDERGKALHYLERSADKAIALNATTLAAEMLERAAKVAAELRDPEAQARIQRRIASIPASSEGPG